MWLEHREILPTRPQGPQFIKPVLFVVDVLTFLNQLIETGELPHFVVGHSLGEYGALFAAGVFDFRTGLRLIRQIKRETGGGHA